MSLLHRSILLVERAVRHGHAVSWAGAQSLALGLANPEDLAHATVKRFDASDYAEPTYNASAGLWLWEREALQRFFPHAGRILVGAAGAGREMIALHRNGYTIEGFECAHNLVAAGQAFLRDEGCSARLHWAPPSALPPLEGPFDGAIMGWSGYMYIPLRSLRVKLLEDLRALVRPGGPILLSFQTRELFERRMYWSARGANWIRRLRGVPPVIPGDCLDNGFKHWFTRDDVAAEMKDAGLRMLWYSVDGYGWAVGERPEV